MPPFLVIDPSGRPRTASGPPTLHAVAHAIRCAAIARIDLDPGSGLAGYVNEHCRRDGSEPNAVGSCLLSCLGSPVQGVYAGPVAVVGWDRTRHDLPDDQRLRGLTEETRRLLECTADQIMAALDGFDSGRPVAWDRAVREHGREVRATYVTQVDR